MKPEEWETLVENVVRVLREDLGYDFEWSWIKDPKRITPDADGFIRDIRRKGCIGTDTRKIHIARLSDNPEHNCRGVDAIDPPPPNPPLPFPIKDFKTLASYLVLHELGHHKFGHRDHRIEFEIAANEFAHDNLDNVLSRLD